GFYDTSSHPRVDVNGYGLRVPGMVISPYAKRGYVDHQLLSFDAYLKFIEDDFLGGARLDPKRDGRPDPRRSSRGHRSSCRRIPSCRIRQPDHRLWCAPPGPAMVRSRGKGGPSGPCHAVDIGPSCEDVEAARRRYARPVYGHQL